MWRCIRQLDQLLPGGHDPGANLPPRSRQRLQTLVIDHVHQ
jgi:hypothetical protein